MFCYAMQVPTASIKKDKFSLDGKYHSCIEGLVYVFAECVAGAAAQIPIATQITLIGPAYVAKGESS